MGLPEIEVCVASKRTVARDLRSSMETLSSVRVENSISRSKKPVPKPQASGPAAGSDGLRQAGHP
eukprot:5339272-Lingulodinium_polyedra.AAC.1